MTIKTLDSRDQDCDQDCEFKRLEAEYQTAVDAYSASLLYAILTKEVEGKVSDEIAREVHEARRNMLWARYKLKIRISDKEERNMIIKKKIKTDKKVNPLYARYVIRRDQKKMLKASNLERKVIEGLKAERNAIPVLVEYGLITEEEGVEISMNILKAIGVSAGRDPLEVCKRIAEKLGGEVVEGGDTE